MRQETTLISALPDETLRMRSLSLHFRLPVCKQVVQITANQPEIITGPQKLLKSPELLYEVMLTRALDDSHYTQKTYHIP